MTLIVFLLVAAVVILSCAPEPRAEPRHWAFVAPQSATPPAVADGDWINNPIDQFILARLKQADLQPNKPADPARLLRRLTLDLTGLPPTPAQVQQFLADPSPAAFAKTVDRLLASPGYGERMAVGWLDAARYADTHGYLFDTERAMWRWRDWVIESFNKNLPFDQFTVEQLAGDLLAEPTEAQRIATGFNRNHIINNEAGAIAAEFLVENVVDRVNTTATVWMGLSLACCQCHDHKYDPFSQREYYQLYAFFDNLPELGLDGLNANAKPLMKAPTADDAAVVRQLQLEVRNSKARLESVEGPIRKAQTSWEASLDNGEPEPRGLDAYWAFNDGSEEANDAAKSAAFEARPANYQEGVLGNAAALDGLGYLNAGDQCNFTKADAFSFTVWVRPTVKAGRMSILSRMENAKTLFRGYTLQTFAGIPSFFLIHSFPDNMIQVQAKTALEPDRWYHLSVTYDGSARAAGLKLYIDGEFQKPAVAVDKLTEPIVTDSPFWIGNGHPAAKFKGRIDEFRVYNRALGPEEILALPGLSIETLVAVAEDQRTEEQRRRIRRFFLEHHAPRQWKDAYQSLGKLEERLAEHQRSIPSVMVMKDSAKRRETRLLLRGAYDQKGDSVTADTPAALPPMNRGLPKNRLGLARWLTNPKHPLTARVVVNRIWQMHFGQGIVSTPADFGVQGATPSHPALLDWLAVWLIESGWDLKQFHKLIVTSATYAQDSTVSPRKFELDPGNRLLARGPRHRLSAEAIRDQALFASGLLVNHVGGRSVKPYQPAGLWREVAFEFSGANLTAQIYKQDEGANLFRRSIYTFWKRTAPPPTMLLFDAPDRERCVVRRNRTNTPLQALALMNDPTFVEAANKLAERAWRSVEGIRPRIEHMFALINARRISSSETDLLEDLFHRQRDRFAADPELALALLNIGDSDPDPTHQPSEMAAYAVIANVILNLDETVSRP